MSYALIRSYPQAARLGYGCARRTGGQQNAHSLAALGVGSGVGSCLLALPGAVRARSAFICLDIKRSLGATGLARLMDC